MENCKTNEGMMSTMYKTSAGYFLGLFNLSRCLFNKPEVDREDSEADEHRNTRGISEKTRDSWKTEVPKLFQPPKQL